MSLQIDFLEKGTTSQQHLGLLTPGNVATIVDMSEDTLNVLSVVCLRQSVILPEQNLPLFGQIYTGGISAHFKIKLEDLDPANHIGNVAFGGFWCREVITDENETGLLLVSHLPDSPVEWPLS